MELNSKMQVAALRYGFELRNDISKQYGSHSHRDNCNTSHSEEEAAAALFLAAGENTKDSVQVNV